MKRGGVEEFWRSVGDGLELYLWGWVPWSIEIDRRRAGRVEFLSISDAGLRRETGRTKKVAASARPGLVRDQLDFLRAERARGWQGVSVEFRRVTGVLTSRLRFVRDEGLTWTHALRRPNAAAEAELRRLGLRPGEPHQIGSDELLHRAQLLRESSELAPGSSMNT